MSSQPQQDFALGYSVMQRSLDSKLAEFQNVQRSEEMQQQFVRDSVTAATRQIANGGFPPDGTHDTPSRVHDRHQFRDGMQRGLEEWANSQQQQQTQHRQAVIAQQAQETDQGQKRQQHQHRANDIGQSL